MNRRPTMRQRDEFQRAFRKGTRTQEAFLQVRTYRRDDDGPPHLGIVIRSATMKRSVRRNRVRRLLREAFRMLVADLPHGVDVVLIPQSEPAVDHLHYVLPVLASALKKAQVIPGETPPVPPAPRRNPAAPSGVA